MNFSWDKAFGSSFLLGMIFFLLLIMSIVAWAVSIAKYIYLNKVNKEAAAFSKEFWDSSSLAELNKRLDDFEYSPSCEAFRRTYSELIRSSRVCQKVLIHPLQ